MKQLTRFQMAAVKRTAQNTKKLVSTKDKLNAKIHELAGELVEIQKQIDAWEEPIKVMTGGYTSSEVIELEGKLPDTCVAIEESSPESDVIAEAADAQIN